MKPIYFADSEDPNGPYKDNLDMIYRDFKHVLDTLEKLNDLIPTSMEKEFGPVLKELEEMTKTKGEEILTPVSASKLTPLLQKFSLKNDVDEFIREMSLVYLVARFHDYLERALFEMFWQRGEMLKQVNMQLDLVDIIDTEYKDFDLRILEMVVDHLTHGKDIEEINKVLVKFKVAELMEHKDWKPFKERFYRRNILIHRDGRVDEGYRRKTGYSGEPKKLDVNQKYLSDSLELFDKYALILEKGIRNKFPGPPDFSKIDEPEENPGYS